MYDSTEGLVAVNGRGCRDYTLYALWGTVVKEVSFLPRKDTYPRGKGDAAPSCLSCKNTLFFSFLLILFTRADGGGGGWIQTGGGTEEGGAFAALFFEPPPPGHSHPA